jgi:ketosteroid isomerase-like protein
MVARMSRDDAIRLTKGLFDALSRKDRDAWVSLFSSDFEGRSALVESEGGERLKGAEGGGSWFDNLLEVFETVEARLEQTLAVGDHALQLVRIEYVGKGSGLQLARTLACVIQVRDGRCVFASTHFDLAEGFREMAERLEDRLP